MDISYIWNDLSITGKMIALMPVRFQPLHNGHVRYLVNVSRKFFRTLVLLETEFGDEDNPFSLLERKEMVQVASIKFDLKNVIALPILEAELQPIQKRIEWYLKLVENYGIDSDHFVIISGNETVLNSYIQRYGFNCINWNKIEIQPIFEIDQDFFAIQYGNGKRIRAMIRRDQVIPKNILLPEIVEIIKKRFDIKSE